tara:strand:- start:166 stop:516 length:351 start_codon:yes stop_codon:yes gene_type:complete
MSETYRRVGDSIVRLKDDKVMAAIKDGEVCPSAPAYFKKGILEELNALLTKGETKVEPSDWAKELMEDEETPVIPFSQHRVDPLARELKKVYYGPKPVHRDMFVVMADFVRKRYEK